MWRPKGAEEIDHAAKEGPTGRDDLTHVMEGANQRLELGARAPSFRLPVKEQRLCSGKHGLRKPGHLSDRIELDAQKTSREVGSSHLVGLSAARTYEISCGRSRY